MFLILCVLLHHAISPLTTNFKTQTTKLTIQTVHSCLRKLGIKNTITSKTKRCNKLSQNYVSKKWKLLRQHAHCLYTCTGDGVWWLTEWLLLQPYFSQCSGLCHLWRADSIYQFIDILNLFLMGTKVHFYWECGPKILCRQHISTYKMGVNGKVGPAIKSHNIITSPTPHFLHNAWAPHILSQY